MIKSAVCWSISIHSTTRVETQTGELAAQLMDISIHSTTRVETQYQTAGYGHVRI